MTPKLLEALGDASVEARRAARDELLERFGVEEPPSGLPAVVRELVARLELKDTPDRALLLLLLVDLATGDPDEYVLGSFHASAARARRGATETEALRAFEALEPVIREGLREPDAFVRSVSAFAAPFLEARTSELVGALSDGSHDRDEYVRTSAQFALAAMARDALANARAALHEALGGSPPRIAALVSFVAGESALDDAQLTAIAEGLLEPAVERVRQPWSGGDLGDLSATVLRAHGEQARVALPGVLAAVERERDRPQMRDASLALALLLGDASRVVVPSSLSAEERHALLRLARSGAQTDYGRYGLPERPEALLRALEPTQAGDASAIETELALVTLGTRPVWQWFAALFDDEVDREALLRGLVARFSPAELLELMRDATRGAFDAPLPPLGFVEAALAHTGDELAPYVALADDTLGLAPEACSPPAALLAVLPLVRRGSLDPKYERLAARALRGNEKAVVIRLEALLGPELVQKLRPPKKK